MILLYYTEHLPNIQSRQLWITLEAKSESTRTLLVDFFGIKSKIERVKMDKKFEKFVKSHFGLEIWSKEKLIFCSKKESISGLLDFIKKHGRKARNLTVFDKKVGNAVALLCVYIGVREVFGVVGSKSAAKTFKNFKIKYHFLKTIPRILNKKETGICPLEKLSLFKASEEFYNLVKN